MRRETQTGAAAKTRPGQRWLFSYRKIQQEEDEWAVLQRRVEQRRRLQQLRTLTRRLRSIAGWPGRLIGRLSRLRPTLGRRPRPTAKGARAALRNPLVIIPPLVLALVFGWQHYIYAGRDLSLPSSGLNILPNGNFDQLDNSGVPTGWQLSHGDNLTYRIGHGKGFTGDTALQFDVDDYRSGDITLTSPKVAVQAGTSYLLKGYYTGTAPFALLVRYYTDSGSDTRLAQTYANDTDTWTTASAAFKPPHGVTAVQILYRLYGDGQLQLNSLYLEPQNDVYIPSTLGTISPGGSTNTIPNPTLAAADYDVPTEWSTYHRGSGQATFTYAQAGNNNPSGAVTVQLQQYKNGQAKWQYTPQPVQPDQSYQFSVSYRSDTSVPVVAEYLLQNGGRQDYTIAQLPPADDWTTIVSDLRVPSGVTSLFVSLPLEQNGSVSSRGYQLVAGNADSAHWQQPMASITFDDGWQSDYDTALPVLQQYGYKATFYVNPSAIETAHFMTARQLNALSQAGNEIGAHSYQHIDLTAINDNALDYQLHVGRDYLRDAGFTVNSLSFPYGRSDAEVQYYARHYYTTARGTATGINTRQGLDPYNLLVIPIAQSTRPADITAVLKQAAEVHGWVIFNYHQIGDSPEDSGSVHMETARTTPDNFRQQLDRIHASGIKVLPVSAAYQQLQQK